MNLEEIISFLKDDNTEWSSRFPGQIELSFDIMPSQYLEFAEEDLKIKNTRGLVNALSNAKRSLDCQIHCLLTALGVCRIAKKNNWNVNRKIQAIKETGILAPRVLVKINRTRNLMEHEFILPEYEQVSDFIDIVNLFKASTDKYLYDFPRQSEIDNCEKDKFWLDVEFNYSKEYVKITIIYRDKVKQKEEIKLKMNDTKYIDFLKAYLEVTYDY